MFTEHVSGLLIPEGLVTVELADADTGRITHRETAPNFLSQQTIAAMKWFQRMTLGAYIPTVTTDAGGNPADEMQWNPTQHLAYWSDATAENAATEDRVNGDLVGWASRHPVGSPTGKRGVVNVSESQMTDTQVKWVFDWGTSQGNGTFQSVGWTRINEGTGFPIARWPENDRITFTQNGVAQTYNGGFFWDATNSVWNVTEYSGVSTYVLKSAAPGGGALTTLHTLPNWSSTVPLYGICRLGTDVISVGSSSTGAPTPRIQRSTSAGVNTWSKTEAAIPNHYYLDVTVDGSGNIWTVATDGLLRRHNPADGSIVATVTLAGYTINTASAGQTGASGIAYDPADGNFWVMATHTGTYGSRQVWKVNASGVAVGPFFSVNDASVAAIASTAPWAGTYDIPGAAAREPYYWALYRNNANTPVINKPVTITGGLTMIINSTANPRLAMKGTELWLGGRNTAGVASAAGVNTASALRGGTLGTRSRLASPVTKDSSKTLKLTYVFQFA